MIVMLYNTFKVKVATTLTDTAFAAFTNTNTRTYTIKQAVIAFYNFFE